MCQKITMIDLPNTLDKYIENEDPCVICWKAKFRSPVRGLRVSTENYIPGSLLNIDFKFYDYVSIRDFTSVLTIIDAKTRYLWVFPGCDKKPPINKLTLFFDTIQKQNMTINQIHVDEGGELARSTDFIQLLLDQSITLQTTGGYNSWLNGKK